MRVRARYVKGLTLYAANLFAAMRYARKAVAAFYLTRENVNSFRSWGFESRLMAHLRRFLSGTRALIRRSPLETTKWQSRFSARRAA